MPLATSVGNHRPGLENFLEDPPVRGIVVDDKHRLAGKLISSLFSMPGRCPAPGTPRRIENRKVLPWPSWLSAEIRPPISSIRWLEMARPSPVPPCRLVVDPSACSKGSKIKPSFSAGMPTPVSLTVKTRLISLSFSSGRLRLDGHENLAPLRELDRVADQVDQHLPESIGITDDQSGTSGLIRQASSSPLPWARSASVRIVPSTISRSAKRDRIENQLPGLDLGEIEDVVDDGQERLRRMLDDLEILALTGIELGIEHEFRHADDAVHRRANLVAHVGEELALGPIG